MATRDKYIRHLFGGGWATDFGPITEITPDQAGQMVIPFLINAENIVYEADGGPRKAPGASKINSVAFESGAAIRGIYDLWLTGTGPAPDQHRLIHVGFTIKKDDADQSFTNLFTGLSSDVSVPDYTTFEDLCIIADDSADPPRSWDGTTAQNLAGSPPNFAFSVSHKNKVWAAGDKSTPSRLYYSVSLDGADWIGSGSGSIDVDPDDGDRITAIWSHKNELWVMKGPINGSIHRVSGSAPTGSDAFSLQQFTGGVGAACQSGVFTFGDDLGFVTPAGAVTSLSTTASFSDFVEATLTRPISEYITETLSKSGLRNCRLWAVNVPDRGVVMITFRTSTSQTNNIILLMDYRFQPVRWALWTVYPSESLALVWDTNGQNRRLVWSGGNDGFLRRLDQPTRSIDTTTAIPYKVTTPFMSYGAPIIQKSLRNGSIGIEPKNNGNVTFGWAADRKNQQTIAVSQGGADVLGAAAVNPFTLGTSTLGGNEYVERFFELETGDEFRSVQVELTNAVNNADVEIHSFSLMVGDGAESTEN